MLCTVSILAEQEEVEKIGNCTISEMKQTIYVFKNFSNKNMWQEKQLKERNCRKN